jgi:hypothetical protein
MTDDLVRRIDSLMILLNMERKKSLSLGTHIEKLEAALRKIDRSSCLNPHDICDIARKALEGKND